MAINTILLIVAFILAVLAAANIPSPRLNLGWLAFAFFIASLLVGPVFHLR